MNKIKNIVVAVLVRVTLIYYFWRVLKFLIEIPFKVSSKVEDIKDNLHDKKISKMKKESEKLRELNEAQRELESAKNASGINNQKEDKMKGIFNKLRI